MWCLVLFDLPVETREERHEASKFREALLESGFSMIQFSVYGKYSPTLRSSQTTEKFIRNILPNNGKVCILHLTDNQWANAVRFSSGTRENDPETPEQLVIF